MTERINKIKIPNKFNNFHFTLIALAYHLVKTKPVLLDAFNSIDRQISGADGTITQTSLTKQLKSIAENIRKVNRLEELFKTTGERSNIDVLHNFARALIEQRVFINVMSTDPNTGSANLVETSFWSFVELLEDYAYNANSRADIKQGVYHPRN